MSIPHSNRASNPFLVELLPRSSPHIRQQRRRVVGFADTPVCNIHDLQEQHTRWQQEIMGVQCQEQNNQAQKIARHTNEFKGKCTDKCKVHGHDLFWELKGEQHPRKMSNKRIQISRYRQNAPIPQFICFREFAGLTTKVLFCFTCPPARP